MMKKLFCVLLLASVGAWAQTVQFTEDWETGPTSWTVGQYGPNWYMADGGTVITDSTAPHGTKVLQVPNNGAGSHMIWVLQNQPTTGDYYTSWYQRFASGANLGSTTNFKFSYVRGNQDTSHTCYYDGQGQGTASPYLRVICDGQADSGYLGPFPITGGTNPTSGYGWHHLEEHRSASTYQMWYDGVLLASVTSGAAASTGSETLSFGVYCNDVCAGTTYLDDIQICTGGRCPDNTGGGGGAPSVITTSLPNGKLGRVYSQTLSASGGTAPYTWSLVGGGTLASKGAACTGLALSSAGVISGTPTTGGSCSFSPLVTDSLGATANRALSITVATLSSIAINPAPTATVSQSASQQFTATGTYSDSSSLALTTLATWASSNTSTATIGASTGLALACVSCTTSTNITATYQGTTSPATALTVVAPGVSPSPGPGDTIIFQDNFESGNISAWYRDGTNAPGKFTIVTTPTHGGTKSLKVIADTAIDKLVARLNCPTDANCPGYDEIYAKFYVQWPGGTTFGGHFVQISGSQTTNFWSSFGQGGVLPTGTDFFAIDIDPEVAGQHGGTLGLYPFMFYTYWPDMLCPNDYDRITNRDCFGNYVTQTNANQTDTWNGGLVGVAQPNTTGVWHEVVARIKVNTIGLSDGLQEMWVDGVKVISQTLRFRTTTGLSVNLFAMPFYLTDATTGPVYLDDMTMWRPGGGGGDTTPPVVSMTAPSNGATVSGASVAVSATCTDNVAVQGVQFRLDGVNLGSQDTIAPYSITWNSTTTTNGSHSLTALCTDTSGNTTLSTAVTVTVANVPAAPTSLTNVVH